MRTNIDIDENLLKEAFKYTKVKTKKGLITLGLKEFIENHRRKDLRDIKGKIRFRDDYDYKKMRNDNN